MYILGLHTGHGATVSLLKDGKIIACASEERFNRRKNFIGWPTQSLAWVLEFAKISIRDIDAVALPSADARSHMLQLHSPHLYTDGNKPLAERSAQQRMREAVKRKAITNPAMWRAYAAAQEAKYKLQAKKLQEKIREEYAATLGIDKSKVHFIEHHLCHAASPAFNLKEQTLIFTLDGEGDGLCATVNVFDGRQKIQRLAKTHKDNSIGILYLQVTKYLGMKGNEHEFKVMGLAPYAKDDYADSAKERFAKIIGLDPKDKLKWKAAFPMPFSDVWLEEKMRGVRFDNVSGGLQKLTEDLIVEWVQEGIRRTGIKNVALSGGVFMNVKASQRVAQMPEVNSIFVMPSAGDESLVFGAMWQAYQDHCARTTLPFTPRPFKDLYLGREFTDEQIKAAIDKADLKKKFKVKRSSNIEEDVAALLAKGEVVARFSGRAEWGARALGNRSILANPSNFDTVKLINEMIKNRDFWMPFTPSMLDTEEKRYIVNPKKIFAPYMILTFDSTPLGQQHLPAAMHPYDKTLRPQIVLKEWNPSYYALITAFKKRTGIGGLLNTSFNLHGEPNVDAPEDAFHTLVDSGLRNLAIGNYLIQK